MNSGLQLLKHNVRMYYIMRDEREIKRRKPLEKRKVRLFNMRMTQSDYDVLMAYFGSSSKVREFLLSEVRRERSGK